MLLVLIKVTTALPIQGTNAYSDELIRRKQVFLSSHFKTFNGHSFCTLHIHIDTALLERIGRAEHVTRNLVQFKAYHLSYTYKM